MTLESIEQMRKWATLFDVDNARRVHGFADWIEREIAEKYIALPLRPDGTPVNVGEVYDDPVLGEVMVAGVNEGGVFYLASNKKHVGSERSVAR